MPEIQERNLCGSVGFPTRHPSRILLLGLAPVPVGQRGVSDDLHLATIFFFFLLCRVVLLYWIGIGKGSAF